MIVIRLRIDLYFFGSFCIIDIGIQIPVEQENSEGVARPEFPRFGKETQVQ